MAKKPQPTGTDMVAAARSFLGIPYLYGGTDPRKGLDCSGLVLACCNKIGIHNCPRTSEEQIQWVDKIDQWEPGCLAFFTGDPIDPPPGHVGIVVSDGRFINAPFTGTVVRYDSYGVNGTGSNKFMGYGRIPGAGKSVNPNPSTEPGQSPEKVAATFASGVAGIFGFIGVLIVLALIFGALLIGGVMIT